MARDHARILTAIWRDEDFRALPASAQHAYLTVVSQEELSYAGRLDFRPGRLAALAKDSTATKIDAAIKVLERNRFVVVDRGTEELLVRTYVRHDGLLDRRNMGKAMGRAMVKIVSTSLRSAIHTELGRLYAERPKAPGWAGLDELYPAEFATITALSSTIPFPLASGK
ncbi:hypothetical protein EFK50_01185 [Nocardioides marmoriginsengisoli]|uniref:Uncharacterized protein n=1 Tax=Nocardioides marmoriginsengisoli TaxID=661483 RepID=A0A3N0CS92_9ACTN|nr:hypothetical protein [Nocardioides marmoriginsengisoli]RNL66270.1 hypothetical protein EFK50_01185 [Nocardioides marmoriginsengisoli]